MGQARRRAPCGHVCDSGAASWALVHLASSVVARALCTWCSWPVAAWALYGGTCRSGEHGLLAFAFAIQVRRRGLWWI